MVKQLYFFLRSLNNSYHTWTLWKYFLWMLPEENSDLFRQYWSNILVLESTLLKHISALKRDHITGSYNLEEINCNCKLALAALKYGTTLYLCDYI